MYEYIFTYIYLSSEPESGKHKVKNFINKSTPRRLITWQQINFIKCAFFFLLAHAFIYDFSLKPFAGMPHNFHPPKLTKPNIRHSSVSINVAAYLLHCAKGILQSDRNNVYTCTVGHRRAQGSFKLLQLINCLVFQSNIFRWLIQTRQAIVSDSFEHLIEIESWARQIINWTTTQRCPRTRKITLNLGKLIITSGNGRVFSQETKKRRRASSPLIKTSTRIGIRSIGLGQKRD